MNCKVGWTKIEDHCIYFNFLSLDWAAARSFCQELGGNLLSIRNEVEWKTAKHIGSGSWIGLNSITQKDDPRIFEWSDGSPMMYTPWDIALSHSSSSQGKLADVNCGASSGEVLFTFIT
jgi:Lectin C-type domain